MSASYSDLTPNFNPPASQTSTPHILLIPGSFTSHRSLTSLHNALAALQIPSTICPLPSLDPPDEEIESATCAADVVHVRERFLRPLLEREEQVVIFAHSYGGVVACGAAAEFGFRVSVSEEGRSGGNEGRQEDELWNDQKNEMKGSQGILGLIMHSAMLLPEGMSMVDMMGGALPEFIARDVPKKGLSTMTTKDPHKTHATHATAAFTSPAPKPIWANMALRNTNTKLHNKASRLVYIRTHVEPHLPDFQDGVIARSGADWTVEQISGGHDALETQSGAAVVAKIIKKYISAWTEY